jgi:hypothetical protein
MPYTSLRTVERHPGEPRAPGWVLANRFYHVPARYGIEADDGLRFDEQPLGHLDTVLRGVVPVEIGEFLPNAVGVRDSAVGEERTYDSVANEYAFVELLPEIQQKQTSLSRRVPSGTGARGGRTKNRCASSLGVPSAGVGTCHSPREHRIPSNHRLPRLQRASPSTALDEHRPGNPETIKRLQHDYPGIATLPGLPLPRTRATSSLGSPHAHAPATRSLCGREVCALCAKMS